MIQDFKHAVRVLLQTKGWTTVVLLSLALGIGANTALFSGINGLLLRTVPVPQAESVVRLRYYGRNDMQDASSQYGPNGKTASGDEIHETFSYSVYQALRASNKTLTDIAALAPLGKLNVIVDGKAELASASIVSGNYFRLLNVSAEVGRELTPEDDDPSVSPAVVISHAYWQKRFGDATNVVGKTITVNNYPVTIAGVLPQHFTGIQNLTDSAPDITVPLAFDPQFGRSPRRIREPIWWWLQLVGRLKRGVTNEQVRGNLEGPFQGAAREGWASFIASMTPEQRALSQYQDRVAVPRLEVDSASRGIYEVNETTLKSATTLSAAVALLLVMVCANVANLLLSRAAGRKKEISVRLALGATRSRLIRQLLTESLLVSGIGGMLGIIIGYWARQLLPFAQTAPIDWRVIGFTLSLCVVTAVAFGMIPALRATAIDLSSAMKETSRNISRSRTLLTKSLVVAQVTISLVVLIGAGLFLRTVANLQRVDVGFDARNLVVFSIDPHLNGYTAQQAADLYDRLEENLKSMPGVESVSHSRFALLSGYISSTGVYIQERPANTEPARLRVALVSPAFFETMRIPLVRGRAIDLRDTLPGAPPVTVINEAAARQFFPGEDPLGKRWGGSIEKSGQIEIVGVVRNASYQNLREVMPATAFNPYTQQTLSDATFEVRTSSAPSAIMQSVREAVRSVDSNLPIVEMTTQTDLIEEGLAQEHFFARSYTLFGGLTLLLSAIGLFGVMSYSVARRTNEIGVRMALGARKADITRMVLVESLWMVTIGVVLGIAGASAAGRLIDALLFGLTPTDGWTISIAVTVMVTVSALAAYLPARRASRIHPTTALHYE